MTDFLIKYLVIVFINSWEYKKDYTLEIVEDFGRIQRDKTWNGLMNELVNK